MTWHVEYLTPDRRGEIDESHPYLSALLTTPGTHSGVVAARVQNFLLARTAERQRPAVIDHLPYHVVVDPVSYCNLACPLCVQATDPKGRPPARIAPPLLRQLLKELNSSLIRIDLFNWGEPLLHPEFVPLVRCAADHGLYTRTSTNLSHSNRVDPTALVESGLRYLVVSIDGASQEVYSRYRRGGSLKLVLRNLARIVTERDRRNAATPVIDWQYLVVNGNEHEIDAARALAQSVGVDVFRYGGARVTMATKLELPTHLSVQASADVLVPLTHPLSEYDAAAEKHNQGERSNCRWLWSHLAVHADGGIAPCWSSWFKGQDYATAGGGPIHELWNNNLFREARRTAESGGDPTGVQVCHRCAAHRNFVNTPDRPEAVIDADAIDQVVQRLRARNWPLDGEVARAVRAGFAATPGS